MISYLIALVAALIFLANPIREMLSPAPQQRIARDSPVPQLNESLLAIDSPNATAPDCAADGYISHILSSEPLVIYLENFLSDADRAHLLEIRHVSVCLP